MPRDRTQTKKFKKSDYYLICEWLAVDANRAKFDGTAGKTKAGVRPIVRSKAYEEMAGYVNRRQPRGSTLCTITGQSMKTRFGHMLTLYKKAKSASKEAGFGVTDEDVAIGIHTIEDKLEDMCTGYSKLEKIFGRRRPNVGPEFTCGPQDLQAGDEALEQGEPDPLINEALEENDVPLDREYPDFSPEEDATPPVLTPRVSTPVTPPNVTAMAIFDAAPSETDKDRSRKRSRRAVASDRYMSKKQVNETRHSSFVDDWQSVSEYKRKQAELRDAQIELEQAKLKLEQEKWEFEKLKHHEIMEAQLLASRSERESRIESEKANLKIAMITSSRPIDELREIFSLFGEM